MSWTGEDGALDEADPARRESPGAWSKETNEYRSRLEAVNDAAHRAFVMDTALASARRAGAPWYVRAALFIWTRGWRKAVGNG